MNERTDHRAIWLVRHGESTWNASGLIQGQAAGPVLTRKGRAEAARVGEQLRGVGVAAIYTSDLERARETASIVAATLGLPPQIDRALRERSFGVAEGHPLQELEPAASGIQVDRVVDADACPAGGESLRQLYERVRDCLTRLETARPQGDVLVITHGGVLRVADAYCSGIAVDDMTWGPVPNATIRGLTRPRPPAAVAG
jgi:2,3-bisphosphoglycerate-dependent phosphoglycerate mutase